MEYADSEADESVVSPSNIKAEYDSSEEEEIENEEAMLKKESEGFIVDEPEEEAEESDSSQDDQAADDDSELDIQDEMLDLLNQSKKKRGRLQVESDDEDDDVSEKRFRYDTNEGEEAVPEGPNLGSDEEEDEDDLGNFIVDEHRTSTKSRKAVIHDDPMTQEAQELFGVDLEGLEDLGVDEEGFSDEDNDSNDSVKFRKRREGIEVTDIFDPAELDRGFYTAKDEAIKRLDMPERFQMRVVPFVALDQNSSTFMNDIKDLEEEAKWIYQVHFAHKTFRKEEVSELIKEVLNLLKVYLFEPPFIATYRKEYIEISGDCRFSLSLEDLWSIYFLDEQWIRLSTKKRHLVKSLEKLVKFLEKVKDSSLENSDIVVQLKTKLNIGDMNPPYEFLEFVKKADSMELLKDCAEFFNLYYKSVNDVNVEQKGDDDEEKQSKMLKPSKTNPFTIGRKSNLLKFMRYFGLTSSQFAEHVRDQYAMNEVDHCPLTPGDAAEEYVCPQFPTKDTVLKGVRAMLAYQMSCEPEVRKNIRSRFVQEAFISLTPTRRGKDDIDEHHPMYPMKYINEKPLSSLEDTYHFLYIENAQQDHLINYRIYLTDCIYNDILDKYKSFFHRDEYNIIAQQWNEQRGLVIKQMFDDFLIPMISREIKHKLMKDAQDALTKSICDKVSTWINVQPFIQSTQKDTSYDEKNSYGRILSMTYSLATHRNEESFAFAVMIDGNGEVLERLKLTQIMYNLRRRNFVSDGKTKDLNRLSDLIIKHRPHAVAIATDSMISADLQAVLADLMRTLENQHDLNPIPVELVDNELAIIYQNSKIAEVEFPNYPPLLRQAVSLGRRLQDPMTEFAQLMNVDQDFMNMRVHPLQETLSRDNLYRKIEVQFVNTINSVGVDINDCIIHKHRTGVLQFVSGLGSRKADFLIKTIKKNMEVLSSRNLIIQQCEVGPKVGMNCLGFLKVHSITDVDYDDVPREILDSTRIHPESYDLAKKMAIDALEWDDRDNQAAALEEIMESPEKLRDLDLEAFAEELKRTEHGSKHITLNDIRKELSNRFEDVRPKFRSLDSKERFELLTKETSETLDVGSMVEVRVVSLAHRKPQQDQLDHASPQRNENTGYWICPFCQQENFVELNNVWQHFDSQECPGKVVGVYCELPNRIRAFLATKNISDNHVTNISDRLELDQVLKARVIRIDYDRIQAEVSTKSSDLQDHLKQWRKQKDLNYDDLAEEQERKLLEEKIEKQKHVLPYINRIIFHPQFKNITYSDFEKLVPELGVGEFIIRPSSKGANHLTVSWKVDEDVICHINVLEEGKENEFSLGRILIIDGEKFEDLDEIIASYLQPMVSFVRDAQNYKYYKRVNGDDRDILLETIRAEKVQNPNKIPYFLAPLRKYPCRFIIVYMPDTKERFEFFKITPKGFLFRNLYFTAFVNMIDYFKAHFNERPSSRTTPGTLGRTPMIGSTPTFGTPAGRSSTPPQRERNITANNSSRNRNRQHGPETPK